MADLTKPTFLDLVRRLEALEQCLERVSGAVLGDSEHRYSLTVRPALLGRVEALECDAPYLTERIEKLEHITATRAQSIEQAANEHAGVAQRQSTESRQGFEAAGSIPAPSITQRDTAGIHHAAPDSASEKQRVASTNPMRLGWSGSLTDYELTHCAHGIDIIDACEQCGRKGGMPIGPLAPPASPPLCRHDHSDQRAHGGVTVCVACWAVLAWSGYTTPESRAKIVRQMRDYPITIAPTSPPPPARPEKINTEWGPGMFSGPYAEKVRMAAWVEAVRQYALDLEAEIAGYKREQESYWAQGGELAVAEQRVAALEGTLAKHGPYECVELRKANAAYDELRTKLTAAESERDAYRERALYAESDAKHLHRVIGEQLSDRCKVQGTAHGDMVIYAADRIEKLEADLESAMARAHDAEATRDTLRSTVERHWASYEEASRERDALRRELKIAEMHATSPLWSCPDCGFMFHAAHTNAAGDGYDCPVCEEHKLRAELSSATQREADLRGECERLKADLDCYKWNGVNPMWRCKCGFTYDASSSGVGTSCPVCALARAQSPLDRTDTVTREVALEAMRRANRGDYCGSLLIRNLLDEVVKERAAVQPAAAKEPSDG